MNTLSKEVANEPKLIRACCVCRKIEIKGEWKLPEGRLDGRLTHTYCSPCYEGVKADIREWKVKKAQSMGL